MLSHRGRKLIVFIVIFTTLDLLTLALRFYGRRIQKRALRPDDYLIVFSVASMLALEGCALWAIHNGLGAHAVTLTWDQMAVQIKLLISSGITWTLSTTSAKLAVLFLYLNIFPALASKRTVYFLIAVTAAYNVAFIPYFMTACKPFSAAWDPVLSQTNCRKGNNQELSSVSFNIALDLAIVIFPAPLVWKLAMPRKKKVIVSGVFGLGACVVGVMVWRLVTTAMPPDPPDYSYDIYILALQSFLELWLGIIAANMPTLGPVFQSTIYPRVKAYWMSGSTENQPRSHYVQTFGSSEPRERPRDELDLLSDEGGIELSEPVNRDMAIRMDREFRVSFDSSEATLPRSTGTAGGHV